MRLTSLASAIAVASALIACTPNGSEGISVVASMYPLAWAAASVGGPDVVVTDLTPPGSEAHDATLTAAQRAELQTADVVLYLGRVGFQPDVERAVPEATGAVVDVSSAVRDDLGRDPHIWLDLTAMRDVVEMTRAALVEADAGSASAYDDRARTVTARLGDLEAAYRNGLSACDFTSFVVTHEAFGYLARRYGLRQIGIQGLVPDSEPTAEQIQAVAGAIGDGDAAPAVFFEDTPEGRTIAESVASDAGVPTLPLGTLEADPGVGDYLDVMRANLDSLSEGLRCEMT